MCAVAFSETMLLFQEISLHKVQHLSKYEQLKYIQYI